MDELFHWLFHPSVLLRMKWKKVPLQSKATGYWTISLRILMSRDKPLLNIPPMSRHVHSETNSW